MTFTKKMLKFPTFIIISFLLYTNVVSETLGKCTESIKKTINQAESLKVDKNVPSINGFTYYPEFDSYYKYFDESYNQYIADAFCAMQGSTLFAPESEEEAEIAFNFIPIHINRIWIGVEHKNGYDGWKLYDYNGRVSDYLSRKLNVQNILTRASVTMDKFLTYNFKEFEHELPFLCKKPRIKTQRINDDFKAKLEQWGYKEFKDYNALYKPLTIGSSLPNVLANCRTDGAFLFFPENKNEISILKHLNMKFPVLMGIIKPSDNEYKTSDGQNISEIYTRWAKGEPNKPNDYIVINSFGEYSTASRKEHYPFICKIKLLSSNDCDVSEPFRTLSPDLNTVEDAMYPIIRNNRYLASDDKKFRALNYKYSETFRTMYKVHSELHNLWSAILICAGDGSTLFFPYSKEESREVFKLLPPERKQIWAGVVSISFEENYSLKGEAIGQLNVTNDKVPNKGVKLLEDLKQELVDPDQKNAFVCSKRIKEPDISVTVIMTLMMNGYNYYPDFDAMYKYYNVSKTLEIAFKQCALDGADLFVPITKQEHETIVTSMDLADPIWLGMTKYWRNYYVTMTGKLLSDFYYIWEHNQPDIQYDFVAMNYNGKYFTRNESTKIRFICKKQLPAFSSVNMRV